MAQPGGADDPPGAPDVAFLVAQPHRQWQRAGRRTDPTRRQYALRERGVVLAQYADDVRRAGGDQGARHSRRGAAQFAVGDPILLPGNATI
nr:hypothetical protein [Saccharothrix espanaensis]